MAGLIAAVSGWPAWARITVAVGTGLVASAMLAGLGFGAWRLFDWVNDREAVSDYETKVRAEVTRTELEAERAANHHDETRRAVRESRTAALQQAREQAIDEQETGVVVGSAVRAVMRELRAQADQDRRPAP